MLVSIIFALLMVFPGRAFTCMASAPDHSYDFAEFSHYRLFSLFCRDTWRIHAAIPVSARLVGSAHSTDLSELRGSTARAKGVSNLRSFGENVPPFIFRNAAFPILDEEKRPRRLANKSAFPTDREPAARHTGPRAFSISAA